MSHLSSAAPFPPLHAPAAITLDIDDTCDPVHGHQQLSLFHAHYDTRCILPVHVYHVESGKPVAVLLRPGKTPSGPEVRNLIKYLVRRIRRLLAGARPARRYSRCRAAPLARAEFATLRLRLLKIGARVVEKATRVRIHFTSACPDAAVFRLLAGRLAAAGP